MCGSATHSVFFGSLHVLTAWWTMHRRRASAWQALTAFCCFYAVMEWLQAIQWLTLEPGLRENAPCSALNRVLTYAAYLLIHLQPVMFAVIGFVNVSRRRFRVHLVWTLVALFVAGWNIGTASSPATIRARNFGPYTCTTAGVHGHLSWRFAVRSSDLHPNYFFFLGATVACFFLYRRKEDPHDNSLGWMLGSGWLTSLVFAIAGVGLSPELPAFWCWLSVFCDLPIFVASLDVACMCEWWKRLLRSRRIVVGGTRNAKASANIEKWVHNE